FNMLPSLLARAIEKAPGWANHLRDVDVEHVTSRNALARLPVMRKFLLKDMQAANLPLGGFQTADFRLLNRVFMSPGPIFEPEGRGANWWRSARALFSAGFREDDIIMNTFAYHLTPGAWIVDSGARELGCTVIPAGPDNTTQHLEVIALLKPTAYVGVPDYLRTLLDMATVSGKDTSSLKRALVSGGTLLPALRKEYLDRKISVFQFYATADAGMIAYESDALEGMIVDEGVLLEIVRPGSGDPLPPGEVGEVLVTTFNRDYPMIRLATGDLSAILPGVSSCGRTNTRIKGWMGRVDQVVKVKGVLIHPQQIAKMTETFPQLGRLRLVIGRDGKQDMMVLKVEALNHEQQLAERIASMLEELTGIIGAVQLVPPKTLPNDGRIIDDERAQDIL
ncbi:MAG: AMP-binding protein, partial [Hyphomicrobiaceae bacterium]|nr:AMP-binding protein [Hyphomicrobiaceae bacterium]